MKDIAYILNLTTSYNASNFKYLFLPGISAGKIVLFDTLTAMPLPINKDFQKQSISERFNKLKNHWDFYKLDPNNETSHFKVNIILDDEIWEFLDCGEYSKMLFSKCNFLEKILKSIWDARNMNSIQIQYFIIQNKNEPINDFLREIDRNQGINNFPFTISSCFQHYPLWKDVENHLNNIDWNRANHDLDGKLSNEDSVFLTKHIDEFSQYILSCFSIENQRFSDFISEKINGFKDIVKKEIQTYRLFNAQHILDLVKKHFFNSFSSCNYLRKDIKDKDILFRFTIDNTNSRSKIKSFENLSAFLVESVSFFSNHEVVNFMTSNGEKYDIHITNMEFDEEKRNHLFSIYKILATPEKPLIDNDEKISVKQFQFNVSIDFSQYFKIKEEWEEEYLTVNHLKQKIPAFFTFGRFHDIKRELDVHSIQKIEEFIKLESEKSSLNFVLQGDYGLSSTTVTMTPNEIEYKISQCHEELKKSSLNSNVNWHQYEEEKAKYEREIPKYKEAFLKSLMSIPKLDETVIFTLLSTVFIFLFMTPLYSFHHWMKAALFAIGMCALIVIVGLFMRMYFISHVKSVLYDIYVENFGLMQALKNYVQALKDLVADMRKSTLNRKNIDEMEKALKEYKKQSQQATIHLQFFKEISEQIEQNGYRVQPSPHIHVQRFYGFAPQLYPFKTESFSTNHFTLKTATHKEKIFDRQRDNLEFTLGFIKLIEIH